MPLRRRAIPLIFIALLSSPGASLFAQEETASPPVEQTPSSDPSSPPQELISPPEETTTAPPPVRTAQASPRASSPRLTPEGQLQAAWRARKADIEIGDTAAAAGKIDAMFEVIRTERLDRVTWLARGFAYEGYEHLREGNYERAREAFDIARRIDPMMPEAQTGCAWATLRAGRGVGQFIAEYRKALHLRWQVFKREGTANVYLVAAAVLCLTTISISLLLFMRYALVLRHDVAERMPSGWPEGATQIAGWVVLLAPLFAWTGGIWLLLYWFVLLARYMSAKERALAAVACLATIVVGPLAAWGAATAEISTDPTNVAVRAALQGGYGADVITALQEALNSNPDAVSLRLLLANTYERADLRREAFDEYHQILQEHRDDARALINVGNLYMRQGQTAQAIVYYTRAAEAESHNALCFYNLSIAQNDALRLSDAESSVRMVQQIDPGLARSLVAARARGEEIPPLPASASAEEVWKQVGVRSAAAMVRGNLRPASPTTLGAALTIILLGGISLLRAGLRAQTCSRCGEPFCGRCKRELGARECCAQCIHMFVKKETIAGDVRARKLRQVERFVRSWKRRVRVASILVPGAGHVLAGSTMTGTLLLLAWFVPLSALVCGRWLVLQPTVPVLDLPAITTLLALSVMAILWGIANVFTPRLPS